MRSFALALGAAAVAVLAPSTAAADQPVAGDFFSSFRAVRVVGDRAYAVSRAGLVIYDVSDRANPRKLSQTFVERSGAFKVEVSGDFAYVLTGEIVFEKSFLDVVDVSDPLAPRVVGEFSDLTEARVQALLVTGTIVALGDANAVTLVDVSDPANPTKTARLPIASDPEQVVGLAVNGSTLFATWIGLGGEGNLAGAVTSIDISDPAAPTQLGVFPFDGTPNGMAAVGATLYVGETLTDVVVVDASDPAHMVEATRIPFPLTGSVSVFAKGDRLFTGAEGQEFPLIRVGVYDISNPRSPQALGETLLRCLVAGMDYDVAKTDAFLPCEDETGDGIAIYDVTPAGALDELSRVVVPQILDAEALPSGVALLAASDGLYAVRPAATGSGVDVVGTLPLDQSAYRLQIVGDRAYLLTADDTIQHNAHVRIVDVANPAAMSLLGSLDLADINAVYTSKRFYVDGQTLYVADAEGLVVYDASDPASLQRLGAFAMPSAAENVVVSGGVAYVNTLRIEDNNIRVDLYAVKVKKLARPKLKGKRLDADMANFVSDMAVRDGKLYVLDAGQGVPFGVAGDGRILVFDVSKKRPRQLSENPTSPTRNGYARDIVLAGDLAYVADGLDGVSILSIAGAEPQFLRAIDTPGFAIGVYLDDAGNIGVADQSSFQLYPPTTGSE